MRNEKPRLPVGTEDFAKLRRNGLYYVDKTGFLAEFLQNPPDVSLFVRPRRFGKTLAMSMFQSFLEIGADPSLFDGLKIAGEGDVCEAHLGRHPVVSISLKDVEGNDFEEACRMVSGALSREASRLSFLSESDRLGPREREEFCLLRDQAGGRDSIQGGLLFLTRALEAHYGKRAVLLIDEYDVPLQKAFYRGYYDEMVQLVRMMFSQALKGNQSLEFAVLTGCLRIAKESIFTGLNNMRAFSAADAPFADGFGFTSAEVRDLMDYCGAAGRYERAAEWYDGYQFGNVRLFCPWDVVNYCYDLCHDPGAEPQNYWANSSGNDAVRQFVRRMDDGRMTAEMEALLAGESIAKEVHPELTYREMYGDDENIWSLLYMTGYLTSRGRTAGGEMLLAIPNREVRGIFKDQVLSLFREKARGDGDAVRHFCDALEEGDAKAAEEWLGHFLSTTISIRDTFAKRQIKENFYHGILLGLVRQRGDWVISSNEESGDGYADILIRFEDGKKGIVIEAKYAEEEDLGDAAERALRQIEEKDYCAALFRDGCREVMCYGIACHRKRCRVAVRHA